MSTVTLLIQGVRIQIACDVDDFVDYIGLHLPAHGDASGGEPNISVRVRWLEGDTFTPQALAFPEERELDEVGKRLFAGSDILVWTNVLRIKDLSLRIRRHEDRLLIDAHYLYAPKPARLEAQPDYRSRKFFELVRWFVFYPVAWYLQHFRGLYLMHASGLDIGGRGLVIAGVGGVGKTTTAVALLGRGRTRLISENLIFHDGARIYSCYEPIRLDDASVDLVSAVRDVLLPAEIPGAANPKNMYHVGRHAVSEVAPARVLILPRFARAGYVRPLSVDACLELLVAFNQLTLEVNDFYWFAAALDLLWPTSGSLARRVAVLRELLERMDRYEIGIDRSRGVAPVVDSILERMGSAGGG
ncbi:MAG TPA: hypothetical protein VKE22_17710 [Haliangiales bacterium]|nr:hypothetical protein [Haliangiales bacterium]